VTATTTFILVRVFSHGPEFRFRMQPRNELRVIIDEPGTGLDRTRRTVEINCPINVETLACAFPFCPRGETLATLASRGYPASNRVDAMHGHANGRPQPALHDQIRTEGVHCAAENGGLCRLSEWIGHLRSGHVETGHPCCKACGPRQRDRGDLHVEPGDRATSGAA